MKNSTLGGALTLAIIIFGLLYAVKSFDVYYPVQVTNTNKSTELSVVGEGKVEVVPDTAYVDLGISVNNAASVDAAQKSINGTNNKIIDAMKALGIAKEDIKTSNYSVFPNYSYEGNQNRITGYNGNVTVLIKVKNQDMTTQVIEKATAAGANEIHGTRFSVDKPEKYREEARNKAIENAKEQANKIASNLGIKLGRVVNIAESSPDQGVQPMYDLKERSAVGAGAGPSIEPGTQTIVSTVTLYFEKQ